MSGIYQITLSEYLTSNIFFDGRIMNYDVPNKEDAPFRAMLEDDINIRVENAVQLSDNYYSSDGIGVSGDTVVIAQLKD